MQKIHKGEKGFTLIELLVVIAILGILAAVVVPNVSKFIGSGKTEANSTELKNVRLAVTAAMADAAAGTITGAIGTSTDDFTSDDVYAKNGATRYHLYDYLDTPASMKCHYTISGTGSVTQDSCP